MRKYNKALSEADARRLAGWILGDSGNARIDPLLLVAVMATDGSLQATRAANAVLVIGRTPAERFIDMTARDLGRLIAQGTTNGQVTPAAIHAALGARASAVIAGRRGRDQGVQAYTARVEQLYQQLRAQEPKPGAPASSG